MVSPRQPVEILKRMSVVIPNGRCNATQIGRVVCSCVWKKPRKDSSSKMLSVLLLLFSLSRWRRASCFLPRRFLRAARHCMQMILFDMCAWFVAVVGCSRHVFNWSQLVLVVSLCLASLVLHSVVRKINRASRAAVSCSKAATLEVAPSPQTVLLGGMYTRSITFFLHLGLGFSSGVLVELLHSMVVLT